MLRNRDERRTLTENLKLGSLTAFSAGMVNVTSVVIFFSFTSNVTGHYAILAQEISKGNWYQASIVILWIFLFFFGNFLSNLLVITFKDKREYLGHALPMLLEICCLLGTGIYLEFNYSETLKETEMLVATMLLAMGLQNGLTASISNSAVKTTHLTGLTTDLGILFSQFTKKENRADKKLVGKARLLLTIMLSYMTGGVCAGYTYLQVEVHVLYVVCGVLLIIIAYDYSALKINRQKSPGYIDKVIKMLTTSIEKKESA